MWIECFKVGTHTDSIGNTQEFTEEDLKTIADTYNEKIAESDSYEAPIVKGHPETDAPAFGWVEELKVVGQKLKAKLKNLDKAFVEDVKGGAFKKVSIALYPDLMLRHIGFLGAVQPAVKGLETVKFADNAIPKYYTYEETAIDNIANLKAALAQRIEKYGIGAKDKIGYLEKPKAYAAIEEDNFADPVNFLFPVDTEENLLASHQIFNDWSTKEQYNAIERQVIISRFYSAAVKLGIEVYNKERYYLMGSFYSEPIVLKEKLKREKPELYSEYNFEDFGDPVHFRFPLKTISDIKASIAIFSRENVKGQYNDNEKQFIAGRIIKRALANDINLTPDTWSYVEVQVPIEELSKQQLTDYINKTMNKQQFVSNNTKGQNMEWIEKFITGITQWLSEKVNEEVATQFQSWVEEYKAANPQTPAEETPPPTPEIPPQFAEQLARLEKENRMMKHKEFAEAMVIEGRITPAQRDIVMDWLEAVHNQEASFEFSEKGKKVPLQEKLKALIASFPKNNLTNDFGDGDKQKISQFSEPNLGRGIKVVLDDDSAELHKNILEYQEKNPGVSYKEAMKIIIANS